MDHASFYNFMSKQRHGVLSSLGPSGFPQSALVGIAVTPALQVIFDTVNTSRKYANLIARPACSFVIGWDGEQTVQFEGIAEEPRGASLAHYQNLYFARRPDGPARVRWPGIAYFVVHPRWIRFSDYDRSPPAIHEITLPG